MPNDQEWISHILAKIEILEEEGFQLKDYSKPIEGKVFFRWERSSEWRTDRIQAFYYKSDTSKLNFSSLVYVVCDLGEVLVASCPESLLNGFEVSIPKLFRSLREDSVIDAVRSKFETGIQWMTEFSSKSDCLRSLQNPDLCGNVRISPDSKAFHSILAVLTA